MASTNNAGPIFQGLLARGLSPVAAAGIVGNIHGESGFNPAIWGDNNTSAGLVQWRGPRLDALKSLAASTGRDWRDVDVQLDHLVNELNGPEARAYQALIAAQTPTEASDAFMRHFERPAEWAMRQSGPKRAAFAEQAFASLGGGQGGSAAPGPAPFGFGAPATSGAGSSASGSAGQQSDREDATGQLLAMQALLGAQQPAVQTSEAAPTAPSPAPFGFGPKPGPQFDSQRFAALLARRRA